MQISYYGLYNMKALYTTTAQTHGGRNGHVETTDGLLKLDLAMPAVRGNIEVQLKISAE